MHEREIVLAGHDGASSRFRAPDSAEHVFGFGVPERSDAWHKTTRGTWASCRARATRSTVRQVSVKAAPDRPTLSAAALMSRSALRAWRNVASMSKSPRRMRRHPIGRQTAPDQARGRTVPGPERTGAVPRSRALPMALTTVGTGGRLQPRPCSCKAFMVPFGRAAPRHETRSFRVMVPVPERPLLRAGHPVSWDRRLRRDGVSGHMSQLTGRVPQGGRRCGVLLAPSEQHSGGATCLLIESPNPFHGKLALARSGRCGMMSSDGRRLRPETQRCRCVPHQALHVSVNPRRRKLLRVTGHARCAPGRHSRAGTGSVRKHTTGSGLPWRVPERRPGQVRAWDGGHERDRTGNPSLHRDSTRTGRGRTGQWTRI